MPYGSLSCSYFLIFLLGAYLKVIAHNLMFPYTVSNEGHFTLRADQLFNVMMEPLCLENFLTSQCDIILLGLWV